MPQINKIKQKKKSSICLILFSTNLLPSHKPIMSEESMHCEFGLWVMAKLFGFSPKNERGIVNMSVLDGSQSGSSRAFVSWIIKDLMIVVEQHSRPCSQYYRPQAGHSGLRAKPLNAKQLRSDRGNGISIAANRFGCRTEARCSILAPLPTQAPTVVGRIRLNKILCLFRFNTLREQTFASKDIKKNC